MTALDTARDAARADGVVVVGAGQAGGRAVEALRAAGFGGQITLVGDEVHLPYERPSLSKEMLHDLAGETVGWVRPSEHYAAEAIELRLGVRVASLDRQDRSVRLCDGTSLRYGALVLATGGRPRRLTAPGAGHKAVVTLRTLDDSRALRARFTPGTRLAVIGAGFIGLEVAAAARRHGLDVVVIEAGHRAMARAVPAEISAGHAALHQRHGVDLRFGTAVASIADADGRPVLTLTDGDRITADLVVVGIGTVPNDGLAAAAGLRTEAGIVTDEYGATDDPFVFAAGDVARHFNPVFQRHVLLESWQNAQNQAVAVARNLAGAPAPYAEVPWFWSDQYDVNMQIAGLPAPDGQTVARGDLAANRGVLFQFDGGRLCCAIGLNAPRDVRVAQELIGLGGQVPPASLADPATRLPDLMRALRREQQAA